VDGAEVVAGRGDGQAADGGFSRCWPPAPRGRAIAQSYPRVEGASSAVEREPSSRNPVAPSPKGNPSELPILPARKARLPQNGPRPRRIAIPSDPDRVVRIIDHAHPPARAKRLLLPAGG
jgi:hypothetical protein